MKQAGSKNRKWIGYTLYGILLAVILLYYRFPGDAFEDYLQKILSGVDSNLLLSFDSLSPSFPPGLILLRPQISRRDSPDKVIFTADTLSMRPGIWSLMKMDPVYLFDCKAYDGDMSGYIKIKNKETGTTVNASIVIKDIHLTDNSQLPDIIRRNLSGMLNGTISYSSGGGSPAGGTGEASLLISRGSFALTPPILRLKAIDFNEISLKMNLNNKRLKLEGADLRGRNLLGKASGSIFLSEDLLSSRLDLKCEIEPLANMFKNIPNSEEAAGAFKKALKAGKLTFLILDTIKEPRIQLL